MTYAITQTCCNDASCVAVCPVNCIHPTPEEQAFGSTEMLHIDPQSCIDCGACADACPVDAIYPVDELSLPLRQYARSNAAYFEGSKPAPVAQAPNLHPWSAPSFPRDVPSGSAPLRVAIVGTGPAGMYAAQDLLLRTNAKVTLIDRLPAPGGLARYGVAPDHPATKNGVSETFARLHAHPRTRMHLGLHVGTDISVQALAEHHHAVIYAVGASDDRLLGIKGENLVGCVSAATFVAWYNDHPELAPASIGPLPERVVVIGNGNVALDVARILVSDPDTLTGTGIAAHSLDSLRRSAVREVVVLGRSDPGNAAYARSELLALAHLPGVELVVDDHDPRIGIAIDRAGPGDKAWMLRGARRKAVDWNRAPVAGRRIVFRFYSEPREIMGHSVVRGVRVASGGREAIIPANMILRAVGYRGQPVNGLPFDGSTHTIPHDAGRVAGHAGTYVAGWIKRGPSGGIGANRACASETVRALLADAVRGRLAEPRHTPRASHRFITRRKRQAARS
ncbi:FAD-dependent oxidoreductase [Streptomyces sp. NPDC054887]